MQPADRFPEPIAAWNSCESSTGCVITPTECSIVLTMKGCIWREQWVFNIGNKRRTMVPRFNRPRLPCTPATCNLNLACIFTRTLWRTRRRKTCVYKEISFTAGNSNKGGIMKCRVNHQARNFLVELSRLFISCEMIHRVKKSYTWMWRNLFTWPFIYQNFVSRHNVKVKFSV